MPSPTITSGFLPNTDSPAMKYQKAFGGTNVEDKVSQYYGIDTTTDERARQVFFDGETPAWQVIIPEQQDMVRGAGLGETPAVHAEQVHRVAVET